MDHYVLPSHSSRSCLDPLGLCDEDSPSAWTVITACLQGCSDISQLARVVEDLSYSIHTQGNQDTGFLRQFLLERYPDPLSPTATLALQRILTSALQLPSLFPAHAIPYISPSDPALHLSHAQIRSLLSHQILNTLSPPKGNTWGCTFTCWYSEPQPLKTAVLGYLSTLFDYFELPLDDIASFATIQYRYLTAPSDCIHDLKIWKRTPIRDVLSHLHIEPTTSATVPFPLNGHDIPCTLIASNKEPGFGPSCTQEELVTAACPPLLILGALLVSPPIPPDAALLVSGILPLSHWRGQGRGARTLGKTTMEQHTFLLLDASELDAIDDSTTPTPSSPSPVDLHPPYLLRDLFKCQVGFAALRQLDIRQIAAPLWGAGAFGGDPVVKSLVLALAASREGVMVHLSVDRHRSYRSAALEDQADAREGRNLVSVLEELQAICRGSGDLNVDVDQCLAALYHPNHANGI